MKRKEHLSRLAPLARAIALTLAAKASVSTAQAQQAFSPAWFAAKGAVQSTAAQTGRLPNGEPISSLAGQTPRRPSEQAQQSLNNLNLAARSIAAQQAAQAAARERALAQSSSIVDGLAEGGLEVDTNQLTAGWLNARAPVQTMAGGRTTVTIEQTDDKAILNWQTFNVGSNTTVYFDQRGGADAGGNDWIALNRVNDPSGRPSQIAGQIKADGSVYLINRNGVIFTGSSQVNTRNLVASSLRLSDEQFTAGINTPLLLRDSYGQPTVSVRPQFGEYTDVAPETPFTSVFDAAPWFTPSGTPGDVIVESGAQLSAESGGKVMLFAPHVSNAGTLTARDGQVIMAAGENVWLSSVPLSASAGSVPYWMSPVRGLDVAASAVPVLALGFDTIGYAIGMTRPPQSQELFASGLRDVVLPMLEARAAEIGYRVSNLGHVEVQRGDITLIGRDIVQEGTLLATSALNNREGSVRLLGWSQGILGWTAGSLEFPTMLYWEAGEVAFRPGSVTAVMPDLTDTSELELGALATRYRPGRIEVRGEFIDVQSDSMLMAPAGEVSLHATSQSTGSLPDDPAGNDVSLRDGSRIYLDQGAVISVAGLQGVELAMESNLVEVDLRINELRDSPLYRDSWLRGESIVVDRRASGSFDSGPMSEVDWLGSGREGEWVGTPLGDVSDWIAVSKTSIGELSSTGGEINLKAGGSIIARAGSLLDVSGGSVSYRGGNIDTTKLLGADGRVYDIAQATPDRVYVGIAGDYNVVHSRWGVTDTVSSPIIGRARYEPGYIEGRDAGSISMFAGEAFVLEGGIAGGVIASDRNYSPVTSGQGGRLMLGGASNEDLAFSPGLIVVTDRPRLLAADFDRRAQLPLEYFDFRAADDLDKTTWIDADTLRDSGLGDIDFHVRDDFTVEQGTTLELAAGASLTLRAASLSSNSVQVHVDGNVRIAGGTFDSGDVPTHLGANAAIDVSGQWVNHSLDHDERAFAIDGGAILIQQLATAAAGAQLDVSGGASLTAVGATPQAGDAGNIVLGGLEDVQTLANLTLRGYAAGAGGSLSLLTSNAVWIGDAATAPEETLRIDPSRYGELGFRSVSIGGENVTVDTSVQIVPLNVRLDPGLRTEASGQRITELGSLEQLRPEERLSLGPASLTLTGTNILITEAARLAVDTGGSISLGAPNGATVSRAHDILIRGTLDAPGGTIVLNSDGNIRLDEGAQLLARGVPVIHEAYNGLRTGTVLDGGSVTLSADGATTLAAGALIDVSGAAGEIDLPTASIGGPRKVALDVFSDGGTISIIGSSLVEGQLRAAAGGSYARGGTLSIAMPTGGGGDAPAAEQIKAFMATYIQSYTGDLSLTWEDAIGVDFSVFFGCGCGPFVFTQEFVDALQTLPNPLDLFLTKAVPQASAPGLNASEWFEAGYLDELASYGLPEYDLRSIVNSTQSSAPPSTVLAATFADGGFANLDFQAAGTLRLDGVDVSATRSITVAGALANAGLASSSLSAPLVALRGTEGVAQAGGGTLDVRAQLIDIQGRTGVRGFEQTNLIATDIRLDDFPDSPGVTLDVDGALTLRAGQIYPTSGADATIRATDRITLERNGDVAAPLSAGGSLTLEAPIIEHAGVLRAPFGSITLAASERVTLSDGSITSVSGDGLILPYGQLVNAEFWTDPTQPVGAGVVDITAPPEKRVTLEAPSVAIEAGSQVDVSGGGDLHAWEFVAGLGGSHDILDMSGVFAILPARAQATSPDVSGQRIWLAGGGGLEAGWYTVLPARYAMLPGAYAVMPASATKHATAYAAQSLLDGSLLMSGAMGDAFTSTREQGNVSWRVFSGEALRRYSEYNEAYASKFFSSEAFRLTQYRLTGLNIVTPRLPSDGGALVLKASESLQLRGDLSMQPESGGRGGLLDVSAEKIAIVASDTDSTLSAEGYLVLEAGMLSAAGAGSLLIGGVRSGDPLGMAVDVAATDIVVQTDASSPLQGVEIILAATGDIVLREGSVIEAVGEAGGAAADLVMKPQVAATWRDPDGFDDGDPSDDVIDQPARDWGALVRVSNVGDARVLRDGVDMNEGGQAIIEEGVTLRGGRSLIIDATHSTTMAASASVSGESVTLAGGRVGLGGGTEGLVFDQDALDLLANSGRLRLRSYSSIDFYGAVDFGRAGIGDIVLDAASLVGREASDTTVRAQRLTLENSAAATASTGVSGTATLRIEADEIVSGTGEKNIAGYDRVVLAGERILASGNGSLDAGDADLVMEAALVGGADGASQEWRTQGLLQVSGNSAGDAVEGAGSGARLGFTGGRVALNGRIETHGGAIDVAAGAGDLIVGDGAMLDVSGYAKTFFDVQEHVDAGSIALTAIGGGVQLASGASLDLSAEGGDAGSLSITSSGNGTVVLDGRIDASSPAGEGGRFALDIGALPEFAALGARLNEAGFSAARQFRVRTGDVIVDGVTEVADFSLAADQGRVTITGEIDARDTFGGRIAIAGGDGVVMTSSASLVARATDAALGSGRVVLEATGGRLDVQGGTIDVSGGEGGRVRMRALQTAAHDDVAVDRLDAAITGSVATVLEGVSVYDVAGTLHASAFDGSTIDSVIDDAASHAQVFATHGTAIATRLGVGNDIAIAAGVELRADGDLTLDRDWNLFADFAGQRQGTLTLRAAGNIDLRGSISDGFDTADRAGVLQDAMSWDLRAVAGADLSAASALAQTPLAALASNAGTLTLGADGAGVLVRTGTGDIDIRAGRDIVLADETSAIYSAGRLDTSDLADFEAPTYAVYAYGGGHVSLQAQGSVRAQPTDQHFTEWLSRAGKYDPTTGLFADWADEWGNIQDGAQSTWWVDHGQFRGIGALGGGNLTLQAGRDLDNVVAVLPTQGRLSGGLVQGQSANLYVRNGGEFDIEAGGTILAGQYYVGRGAGSVLAGEMAIGRRTTLVDVNGTHFYDVAPVLALGDATLSVRSQGDLRLETVADPLMFAMPRVWISDPWGGGYYQDPGAYMSGYTPRTALRLVSIGGDVTLVDRSGAADFIYNDVVVTTGLDEVAGVGANLYPLRTHIAALNGSVVLNGPLYTTMPSMAVTADGSYTRISTSEHAPIVSDFQLLAGQDVMFGLVSEYGAGSPEIVLTRATPDIMPSPFGPRNSKRDGGGHLLDILLRNDIAGFSYSNPEQLPVAEDYEPSRIYALDGSILGVATSYQGSGSNFFANEQSWIRAGTDIRDIYYDLRNVRATDTSIVAAGNDIIAGGQPARHSGIVIEGPGDLLVSAGRDIFAPAPDDNQITPFTISSLGNRQLIKGLPGTGASITLLAGLNGQQPDYAGFTAAYLDPVAVASMPDYLTTQVDGETLPLYFTDLVETRPGGVTKTVRSGLISYMAEITGEEMSAQQAWTRFQALPAGARERFLREIFMQELRMGGRDQLTPDALGEPLNGGYNRGHSAIATLFPGDDWKGDILLTDAGLRTLQGGDIELLTPGGGVQLAALGRTPADGRGVITLDRGDIRAFVQDSLLVNRSRMLTFAGGDELIWATDGDIDAGRGAKTTRSFNRPLIETDSDAFTSIIERPDISGSGIGTVEGVPGVVADVDLIAPEGTVNAGDAGIRVAGNIYLAALYVLNADNIDVKGEAKGLPVIAAVNIGALTNASAAASSAAIAAQDIVRRERASSRQNLPSIFSVRVLGSGDESTTYDDARRNPGTQSGALGYDPKNRVQVIGHGGETNPDLLLHLTPTERRLLQEAQ